MILVVICPASQSPSPQNPSPMTESIRAHKRIQKHEVSGRRVPLSLGSLLIPEKGARAKRLPLVIHFHGATWLAEWSVRQTAADAAVIAIQLGSGSGVYSRAFAETDRFPKLLAEAETASGLTFGPIILTSFSAGYGAIREILKHDAARIDGVLLMDSLHGGYTTGSTPGPVEPELLAPFLNFVRDSVAGRKRMLITHSEVFPGTYASTTETADYLLQQAHLTRKPVLKWGPLGMQQLGVASSGGFELRSFAGNSAPDHVDQFHAMSEWLRWFRLK